jgi:exosome complex exonuclease DIS3/RRP44
MIIYRDTYVERQKGESANDRNDRAIREATLWYKNHLTDHASEDIDVVLLTNDEDNRTKAKAEGLLSFTSMNFNFFLKLPAVISCYCVEK